MYKKRLSIAIILGMGLLQGCGSGGSKEKNSTDVVSSTPPIVEQPKTDENNPIIEETKSLIKAIQLLDEGKSLKAADFLLENWSPRAIASAADILYIANDGGAANILRYDLKNKTVLPSIQAENISAIGSAWNRLYDISIYKDRLYTASLSSNRVDVFDIASGEPQIIMSLGTGSWSGDQVNKAIVHAISVAANDQYVFAADIHSRLMFGNKVM